MEKSNASASGSHVSNVISRLELAQAEKEKEQYLTALLTQPIKSRVCVPVPLIKSEDVSSFRLRSQEVDMLTKFVRSRMLKSQSFVNHENISICYCPNVLKSHSGTYSMSVVNPTTRDVKVIVEHASITEAKIYMTNWPRSVPSSQNLFLNVECDGSDAIDNAQLGLFKILWDEKPSFKMIHVKDLRVICLDVPESDPIETSFSNRTLEQFLRRLMIPGSKLQRNFSLRIGNDYLVSSQPESLYTSRISAAVGDDTRKTVTSEAHATASHPVVDAKILEGETSESTVEKSTG